ncbi:ECF transporter S component [Peptostreptococcus russellii]|uniref:ECF transporter S component n=1 Tax=Peptostreptococcus russellii TaxID=215200 RepID=UPI001626F856|nr:ECF transporter S component [Peptostreptococcus russellii]MBC2577868.1 ECF transporter S component [Peptostreptococcus russellii]
MEKVNVMGVKKRKLSTRVLVKVGLLSAVAFLLMFIEMPIPGLFPDFLKIDISDMPALIAGLAMGPAAGICVEIVKNFLHTIVATTTGGVGEIANIIVGSAFVVATSVVYRRKKDFKSLVIGFVCGTLAIIAVGSIVNYFFLLPFYGQLMGMDAIISLGKAVNPNVHNLLTFVIWFIAPFNLIKGVMISILSIPLYKKLERLIKEN